MLITKAWICRDYGLVVNALSPDGIIEGMERRDPEGKSYLMLIQWHPERMVNQDSIFAKKVKRRFFKCSSQNNSISNL